MSYWQCLHTHTHQVLDYNGGRTLDALTKYVEKHVAGIVTDDEEGGEEEQGPEGDEEVPEGDEELGGEDGAGQEEEPSSTEDRHTEL